MAAVPGVSMLARSLRDGQTGTLAAGLGVAAGVAALTVLAVISTTAGRPRRRWRRVGLSVLILAAETGLIWLATEFAARGWTGPTWIVGVLTLVVSGMTIPVWFVSGTDLDSESAIFSPLYVLAEANIGLLAVHFANDHQFAIAWVLAGLALAESVAWMVLPETVSLSPPTALEWSLWGSWGALPVAGTIGAVVVFAVAGNAAASATTGGLGVVATVFYGFIFFGNLDFAGLAASADPAAPGAVISGYARAGGLVIPLGTIIWLEAAYPNSAGLPAFGSLGNMGIDTGIGVCMLILQIVVTRYLRPVSESRAVLSVAADAHFDGYGDYAHGRERYAHEREMVWRKHEDELVRRNRVNRSSFEEYMRERRMLRSERVREIERETEREWEISPDPEYRINRYRAERELLRLEKDLLDGIEFNPSREQLRREIEQERDKERFFRRRFDDAYVESRHSGMRERQTESVVMASSRSLVRRAMRPVSLSPSALQAGLNLAKETGLSVDHAWPNVQLVIPPDLRRDFARRERAVAVLRAAAASALCTAVSWPLGVRLFTGKESGILVAVLTVAPLACMIIAAIAARLRFSEVYQRRVNAIGVYRLDLVKVLRLPLPENRREFASVARYLNSDSPGVAASLRPIVWAESERQNARVDIDEVRQEVGQEVSSRVREYIESLMNRQSEALRRDNADFLDRQQGMFRDWLADQALGPRELAELADRVAERAAGPVGEELHRRLEQAQRQLAGGLNDSVRSAVDKAFSSPALTNFTGYLALELQRSSEEDPFVTADGGTIRAGLGHELALDMSVVRHPNGARVSSLSRSPDNSFLILEPVVIEGGRDAPSTPFDLVADCSTLTPLPRRNSLAVREKGGTPFRFKLPEDEGKHEVWFQLYQAGRLIQVISVVVEVEAGGSAAG